MRLGAFLRFTPRWFSKGVIYLDHLSFKTPYSDCFCFESVLCLACFSRCVCHRMFWITEKCWKIWNVFQAAITNDLVPQPLTSVSIASEHSWKLKPLLMIFQFRNYNTNGSYQRNKSHREFSTWTCLLKSSCHKPCLNPGVWNIPFRTEYLWSDPDQTMLFASSSGHKSSVVDSFMKV